MGVKTGKWSPAVAESGQEPRPGEYFPSFQPWEKEKGLYSWLALF